MIAKTSTSPVLFLDFEHQAPLRAMLQERLA